MRRLPPDWEGGNRIWFPARKFVPSWGELDQARVEADVSGL